MGKVVFDSSFLIALVDKKHDAHEEAIEFLSNCEDIPVGNTFIFAEILHHFVFRIKTKDFFKLFNFLRTFFVYFDEIKLEDMENIVRILIDVKNLGLGFRDSSIINTALKYNAYIVTLDKDFEKQDFVDVIVV